MKRIWPIVVALFLCFPANIFAQGLIPEEFFDLSGLMKNMKVNYYAQAGYQWIGSNLNLPIQTERFLAPDLGLEIGDLDVSLKNANFWSGMVGYSVTFKEKLSFFGSAGGILGRGFVTSGTVPVSIGPVGAPVYIEFTNSNVESWFTQSGIGLGPVLLGLYWDQLQFELVDPRSAAGPLPNQTLKGDILTKTFAPFIGLALPARRGVHLYIQSPGLFRYKSLPDEFTE